MAISRSKTGDTRNKGYSPAVPLFVRNVPPDPEMIYHGNFYVFNGVNTGYRGPGLVLLRKFHESPRRRHPI
mgnify:CR=1 FL=1